MGLNIRAQGVDEVQKYLESEMKKNLFRLKESLKYVGETVVNEIRDGSASEWNDQTGNLRSSTGYIIAIDGKPEYESSFEQVSGPLSDTAAADGGQIGKTFARQVASLYPNGIALIIVAGMEYASYVEAMDNKVVLAQGEINARKLVQDMIEQLKYRYGQNNP